MDFQTAVRTCFSKYADFTGRARRAEFWWFALFGLLGNLIFGVVDTALFGADVSILGSLFSLAILLPNLAVGARRLHDTDRSGWWQLLVFIPVIGILVLIWWWTRPGDTGPNRFGPDPIADEIRAAPAADAPR